MGEIGDIWPIPGREIRLQDPVGSDGVSDAIRQLPTGIRQLPIGSRRKLSESFLLDSDRKLSDVGSDGFRQSDPTISDSRKVSGSRRILSDSIGKCRKTSDSVRHCRMASRNKSDTTRAFHPSSQPRAIQLAPTVTYSAIPPHHFYLSIIYPTD